MMTPASQKLFWRRRDVLHRPPSVLPDISPSRGETPRLVHDAHSGKLTIGESGTAGKSPPLRGRGPAGQRGVRFGEREAGNF